MTEPKLQQRGSLIYQSVTSVILFVFPIFVKKKKKKLQDFILYISCIHIGSF
jgi:dephospho-CoA kinase